ncbi:hypothetical protein V5N11_003319 [Cardamine amara subsp. amara]|uniref:TTF-type domain-containing protein n=1 Tax=Cardamine amara subsp. amara TaxID=228776 RepID=A0ABD1BTV2_CARAN
MKKAKKHVLDITDPGNWENIDMRMRDLLVEKGHTIRLPTDYQFRNDTIRRHFSHAFYTRVMDNKEKQDRRWLVYSKSLDKAFCFCCKLFRHDQKSIQLGTTGHDDWRNLSKRLKKHEKSNDHIICMTRWTELEVRLKKAQTIDKYAEEEIRK